MLVLELVVFELKGEQVGRIPGSISGTKDGEHGSDDGGRPSNPKGN